MFHTPRPASLLIPMMFALAAGLACSSGGGGAIPDAGPHDAVIELSLNLPDGCPPATANNECVGKPCTMGGHECGNMQCTCDPFLGVQLEGIPCFCTKFDLTLSVPDGGTPCSEAPMSYCGSMAQCCSYMSAGYYCLPNACLAGGVCPQVSGS
jgi:hypothetical protein